MKELLDKVVAINPHEPKAWAYRAVTGALAGDAQGEKANRLEAFKAWSTNPAVDYWIGEKLSGKYRFAEGADYQRRSLEFDENYRPARVQLCQDLLRLGKEGKGWNLAAEVFDEDPYNVVAFNLITLRDHLAKFREIKNDHFLLRMDDVKPRSMGAISGSTERRVKWTAKYGAELSSATTVEIFPKQADFAIRTFGLPGGAGFLGFVLGLW